MRHFKTRKEAKKFRDEKDPFTNNLRIFRKRKGQRGWKTKRFAVGNFMEWLNWE